MKTFIYVLALVAVAMADDSVKSLLTSSTNQFTSKFFAEVAKANPGKSVVMSGFSAMSPLAQLGLASVGESHDEILSAIGLPNDNATKAVFSHVGETVRSVKGVELKIANKVYIPEGYKLNEQFSAVSRDVFRSEVQPLNFVSNVEAAKTINTWVEDNTNDRIKDLVNADSLGPDTRAVLVNAIYFKGSWKEKFDKALTRDLDFHVTKDKTIKVPTMFKNGDFKFGYSRDLKAKLLEIFYKGEEASFLVVLPDEIDGLPALQEKLKDPSVLEKATENMFETEVDVYLPKFKIETTIDLKAVLQNIGVQKLFSPASARLENLLENEKNQLYVSEAIQKAFIEVNEEGAEAAAASAYYFDRIMGGTPQFVANRPFFFTLNHDSVILFSGIYKS